MTILHRLRSLVRRPLILAFALATLASTLSTPPATTNAAELLYYIGCNRTSDGQVTVLDSNGYVFQYLDSSGVGVNRLYTAPADRGFRSYPECDRFVNGRWWAFGHSAVDTRNGWILMCHLYWEVSC